MILDIDRGHLRVRLGERTVRIPGEMFFPGKDKMGFVVYSDLLPEQRWEAPHADALLTAQDIEAVLADVQTEFAKGGHSLDIE